MFNPHVFQPPPPPPPLPGPDAKSEPADPIERFMREMPKLLGSYRRGLQAEGFSPDQAFELVRDVHDLMCEVARFTVTGGSS